MYQNEIFARGGSFDETGKYSKLCEYRHTHTHTHTHTKREKDRSLPTHGGHCDEVNKRLLKAPDEPYVLGVFVV